MRIGLVTTAAAREIDEDHQPLAIALGRLGYQTEDPGWDDASVDWSRFDAIVLRSTWNYAENVGAFLNWIDTLNPRTRLFNPACIVRWNVDKRYLLDLHRSQVPVVPTSIATTSDIWEPPSWDEYVVKPAVGSGSRGARRFQSREHLAARNHVNGLQALGFDVLTQPYLASVDNEGETCIVFFEGRFSHAARKGPLLACGDRRVEGLVAPETISPCDPSSAQLRVARRALDSVPGGDCLYARVDLVRTGEGQPCVLELELTEPSLYFSRFPGTAETLADALVARLRQTAIRSSQFKA